MSSNVRENLDLKRKQEARSIVKEITGFGVTQSQIYDILYNLSLNLENHQNMQEVSSFLKKYIELFNNEEDAVNNKEDNKKILLKWTLKGEAND